MRRRREGTGGRRGGISGQQSNCLWSNLRLLFVESKPRNFWPNFWWHLCFGAHHQRWSEKLFKLKPDHLYQGAVSQNIPKRSLLSFRVWSWSLLRTTELKAVVKPRMFHWKLCFVPGLALSKHSFQGPKNTLCTFCTSFTFVKHVVCTFVLVYFWTVALLHVCTFVLFTFVPGLTNYTFVCMYFWTVILVPGLTLSKIISSGEDHFYLLLSRPCLDVGQFPMMIMTSIQLLEYPIPAAALCNECAFCTICLDPLQTTLDQVEVTLQWGV